MPTQRSHLAAAELNGRLYAVGGWNGSSHMGTNEAYDPATNTWTAKALLLTPRFGLAAVSANAKVYAFGGNNTGAGTLALFEEYDAVYDYWYERPAMLSPRIHPCAARLPSGEVYVIGGYNGMALGTMEKFEPGLRTLFVHRKN